MEHTITSLESPSELKKSASFIVDALMAEQEMLESAMGYAAEDVHRYIKWRIAGENPERPEMKPWRR